MIGVAVFMDFSRNHKGMSLPLLAPPPPVVYLRDLIVSVCTRFSSLSVWWPLFSQYAVDMFILGNKVLLPPFPVRVCNANHGLLYNLLVIDVK